MEIRREVSPASSHSQIQSRPLVLDYRRRLATRELILRFVNHLIKLIVE